MQHTCKYCGRTYESTEPNPAACSECQACMDEAAQAIAEDAAAPGGVLYIVDQSDAIHKEGTEAECLAFLADPITKEVAEAGGLSFSLCPVDVWNRRNSPEDLTDDNPGVIFFDGIPFPIETAEQREADSRKRRELVQWAHSLTTEQINKLCDLGYYNDAMKGYCKAAAREMGLSEDQSRELLQWFGYVLDVMTKEEAENSYRCTIE